ncbi:glycerophosphodiester phosphodiesterase [Staphylococcus succinus]|uniref:glycerophosphodiester phosphodiesterase n=1 Tax=Staphylococcus succinus TaxID=61015 RepID=UPI000E6A8A02|nr:glycerophosphodiester phosphodiesterase [Staphylococcus succinus]RIN22923.1 glycerophosphodiester phosphodiesterase [Staphylococcus succinus]
MKNVKRIMVSSMTVLSLSLLASTSMAKADENNDASQVQTKPVAQQQDTQKQNQVNTQEQTQNTTSSAKTVNEADDKRADTKEIHNLNGEKYATIAHRGASGYAPEHTFPAYDKSHNEIGASYIEIDLQMTKDGKLVAMHDETVDRTTNGTGRVDSYTLKELKKLDAGSKFNEQNPDYADEAYKGAKVPTLDQIIDRYGANANYYIETKSPDVYPGMEEKLLDTLDKHNLLTNDALNNGHVIVQSFSQDSIEKMNNLNPDVPLVRLLNKGELPNLSEQDLEYIKKFAIGVGPHYTDLTKDNVKNLKELGFLVHPYTVNTKADMERLNSYGVDGVFTNYADIYKQVVGDSK